MDLRTVANPQELESVFPVIRELRKNLTFSDFLSLHDQARARDDYQLVAIFEGPKCIAAMGYRILHDLVHGMHLYVDDLVVTETRRSSGWGARLLEHAEEEARKLGCRMLRLCTGIENEGGKRFYERNGWSIRSVAYKRNL